MLKLSSELEKRLKNKKRKALILNFSYGDSAQFKNIKDRLSF